MAEEQRAFGYICPDCGKPVFGERTHFALCAAASGLVCGCGRSELTAEPFGEHYRVTVPCGACGGEHRAEVPADKLLHGPGVALACPESKQLCCYIGDAHQVRKALRELEITLEKKKEHMDSAFVDNNIMYEVLSELKDIAARDGISCTCGARGCGMEIHGSAVDLICRQCGARLRVNAATDEDLDRLCCQYTLTIRGGV
ncbi:MAG: hypothetical protein K2O18_01565 [Oscillospiraceae bacterium]|nr:hypothetical protein [Oscillospiraceae bacterium]